VTTKLINQISFELEGQRKALFEICEAERISNADQILQLKKEIALLIVDLHECTTPTAKYRIQNKRIVDIIGPLADKTAAEVRELLDLQVIDNSKRLDLLRYKIKQRRKYFTELGAKYQLLVSQHEQKELMRKVVKPVKKSTSELQNAIHAVEVQIREAVHIKNRYCDIRKSLKDDADKFDSNVKKLEEDLEGQKIDIDKLQKIMDEATRMRNIARGNLLKEERAANSAANLREKEATEGKRLVNERKIELERLERRIFQGGKILPRPEPEGAEDAAPEDEKSPTPPHPVETLAQAFEVLKQATGGTSSQEVLERFKSQKDTEERLMLLRKKAEEDKHKLEKKTEVLKQKLDSYKYAEVKDAERKTGEMERIQKTIEENHERSRQCKEEKEKKDEALKSILAGLQGLYLCINPLAILENNALVVLNHIQMELKEILRKINDGEIPFDVEEQVFNAEPYDDKWLPTPYSGLIRRTPLPQPGTSPAPPATAGSEDEEEVPSRGYLKRQAQLVIDAKSRRKNLRIQLPKRN
ncbi:shootin-1, partial [Anoplophora glabripennis]|uniref:shootin-1 n=1 Tax=Anoplophora glabripennis TaxID=217634 RepID=UPI000873E4AA